MKPRKKRKSDARSIDRTSFKAFFDGCCEPINPGGTAGYGALIMDEGKVIWEHSGIVEPSPTTSSNVAEYLAVCSLLEWITENKPNERVDVFGDSRLVICQLWGWPAGAKRWQIHGVDTDRPMGRYAEHAAHARVLLKKLPLVRGDWISRDKNDRADELSKAHLKNRGIEFRIQPETGA